MKHYQSQEDELLAYPPQWRHLGLDVLRQHKHFLPAYKFFLAGSENREFDAVRAFKADIPWTYSFSMESAVSYLQQVNQLNLSVLADMKNYKS